jgi:signal transduction histidine kinase
MQPSILIVDDESAFRSAIAVFLTDTGYVVEEAESGEAALSLLDQIRYDIVFVDLRMPGIDGLTLLDLIKKRDATIEVVVVTSHMSVSSAITALRLGAYDYLIKPLDDLEQILAVVKRISDKMLLAAEKKQLLEDLRDKNRELEAFVYTVSHDLKSPVLSMQGMAVTLLQDYSNKVLDEKGKHYIERIISNAHYMEELIMGLLTLSRVGRNEGEIKRAEIRETLKEILALNNERFREKGIDVVIQPSLPRFVFNHVYLTQIFQNLVTNAAKFMGGQPHPRIEIGGTECKDYIEFYVKDNGIGIDPKDHKKVFGIFQRLKEVEVEGSGVGLAIVKKIVDLVGGKIRIVSEKGKGATFFVQIPR